MTVLVLPSGVGAWRFSSQVKDGVYAEARFKREAAPAEPVDRTRSFQSTRGPAQCKLAFSEFLPVRQNTAFARMCDFQSVKHKF